MSLARVHTFVPGEVLTAAVQNAEFDNFINNPITLISPTTGVINFAGLAHTNLAPLAISASSATTGQVLLASTGTTVWAAAPFSLTFETSEIVPTANTVVTVAHGLGGRPTLAQLTLRCVTSAVSGYSTGDELVIVGTLSEGNAANRGATVAFGSTSVSVIMAQLGVIYDKATGADITILSSVWRYVARVWK